MSDVRELVTKRLDALFDEVATELGIVDGEPRYAYTPSRIRYRLRTSREALHHEITDVILDYLNDKDLFERYPNG